MHWQLDAAGRAMKNREPVLERRKSMAVRTAPADSKGAQLVLAIKDQRLNQNVNAIRGRVSEWRADGYQGVTATTRRLLDWWTDDTGPVMRLFFAQVEAIETLIWLREVARRDTPTRRAVENLSREYNDGIVRYACKMATGTGKPVVMGMLIAWQTLNAVRTQRTRNLIHGTRFVVLTPGHTVRERLAVLAPSHPNNVYDEMGLVPRDLRPKLNRAKVQVVNFQAFNRRNLFDSGPARKMLGAKAADQTETAEAACRRVLRELLESRTAAGNLTVINDEAHHCYLPERNPNGDKDENKIAAVWFNAVRTLRDVGALGKVTERGQESVVYDFSATPMWITSTARSEPRPFEWVTSDFGLMDAIESGLVKVPRIPIDDDTRYDETVWRKIYTNTKPKKLPAPPRDGSGLSPCPNRCPRR